MGWRVWRHASIIQGNPITKKKKKKERKEKKSKFKTMNQKKKRKEMRGDLTNVEIRDMVGPLRRAQGACEQLKGQVGIGIF